MKERILAILGAIALVAAAFVARSLIAGDDGSGSGGGGGGGGRPVVACTPDLMAVCDALVADERIAADPPELDLGDEAAAARVGDRVIDGWITWDPAPRIANFDAEEAGSPEPWDAGNVVMSDRLALLLETAQRVALAESCGGAITWFCLGRSGDVPASIGVGQVSSAEGLARLAPIAKSLDLNDLNDVDTSALSRLLEGPPAGQSAVASQTDLLVVRGRGEVGSVVGPRRALDAATETVRGGNLSVVEMSPDAGVSVVLVSHAGFDLGDLPEQVREGASGEALGALGVAGSPLELVNDELAGFLFKVRAELV